VELVVKDTTDFPNSASYLDLYLEHDINGTLTTKLYMINVTILTFLSYVFSSKSITRIIHVFYT